MYCRLVKAFSLISARRATLAAAIGIGSISAMFCSTASAERYWAADLTDWSMYLNNGVVYIASAQFASHCVYSRGEFAVNDSAYSRALYAYALSAKARGRGLAYVVDSTASTCVIDALREI